MVYYCVWEHCPEGSFEPQKVCEVLIGRHPVMEMAEANSGNDEWHLLWYKRLDEDLLNYDELEEQGILVTDRTKGEADDGSENSRGDD